ncbi:MAG TPA: amidohydrolase family protein [Actinocrinis sp.]|nr:amidohydrolase family protein [Actinocrinis sp.]
MSWIDSHMHFWDPERLDYGWLESEPALNRAFGPDLPDSGRHLISGVVFVEAGRRSEQSLAEVEWVDSLAKTRPGLLGIVAHVPVEDAAERGELLAALRARPLVVGVRRNIQDEAPGFALAGDFVRGVRALAEYGLVFDLCVRHWQLPEVAGLVALVPQVTFVLDHLGKPPVATGRRAQWRDDLERIAAQPNVACKLSGLTTEADHENWHEGEVLPYLRDALMVFGADRCMFGGDWPVATLATTYERWVDVVAASLAALSATDQEAVMAGTARRIYRLGGGGVVG